MTYPAVKETGSETQISWPQAQCSSHQSLRLHGWVRITQQPHASLYTCPSVLWTDASAPSIWSWLVMSHIRDGISAWGPAEAEVRGGRTVLLAGILRATFFSAF